VSNNDQELRIAFVADTVVTARGAGGVVAARQFVDKLRETCSVTLIGTDAYGEPQVRLAAFQFPLKAMKSSGFRMAWPVRKVLARAFAQVDVVHLQFPFLLSIFALSEARKARRPVVSSFLVQPENILMNLGVRSSGLSRLIYYFLIKRLYNRSDLVICTTVFAERKLREHGLTSRTLVVSCGVSPDMIPGDYERPPEHRGFFLIVMVGRLSPEKNQECLIEAVHRSRYRERIKVVIAGHGLREAALKGLASKLAHETEVGFVTRERLRQLLSTADLFVHCSHVELEGIAVLEAMSMGAPVLVARGEHTAAGELALNDSFRFEAGNVDELSKKIDHLIDDPDGLARARESYQEMARTMGFETSVAKLAQAYRDVAFE